MREPNFWCVREIPNRLAQEISNAIILISALILLGLISARNSELNIIV